MKFSQAKALFQNWNLYKNYVDNKLSQTSREKRVCNYNFWPNGKNLSSIHDQPC